MEQKNRYQDPRINTNKKGFMKKKATFFQKGNQRTPIWTKSETVAEPPLHRPTVRHTKEVFKDFVKETSDGIFSIPASDGSEGNAVILRPAEEDSPLDTDPTPPPHPLGIYEVDDDNIIVQKKKLMELFTECTLSHIKQGVCNNVDWDMVQFQPWGLYCSARLTCKSCGFTSDSKRLFAETPTNKSGRKSAVGNLRLMILLKHIPLGPTELQLIFGAAGLRPGSINGMQKLAAKAAKITEFVCDTDMRKWRQHVIDLMAARGVADPYLLSGSLDARYHGVNTSSSVTPGYGARQAVATLSENLTDKHYILALRHESSLCPIGARLKAQGKEVYCGEGGDAKHDGCIATIPAEQAIKECDMATKIAEDLYSRDGQSTTTVCTDSDANARDALRAYNKGVDKDLPDLTAFKDPSHVTRNQRKHIKGHNYDKYTFGSCEKTQKPLYLVEQRKDLTKALAFDVAARVAITLKAARDYWDSDVTKLQANSNKLIQYMLKCYCGDHTSCRGSNIAQLTGCRGATKSTCWVLSKDSVLGANGVHKIHLTEHDYMFTKQVIAMKLGQEDIHFFSRGETTCRNESSNRAITHSDPNNRLYAKDGKARTCAAIGRQNNTFQDFILMTMKTANCAVKPGSVTANAFRLYQRKRDQIRAHQMKPSTKSRVKRLRSTRLQEYFLQRKKVNREGEYRKNQLDRAINFNRQELGSLTADLLNSITESKIAITDIDVKDPEGNRIDRREAQIKAALKSTEHLRAVAEEALKSLKENYKQQQAKEKETKKRMSNAAKERCAKKTKGRITRASYNPETPSIQNDHSYFA